MPSSLSLQARLEQSTAPTGKESIIAVLASITAQEQELEKPRNPIDLVVVLDRSGSMQGEKLELCQRTLKFLIEQGLDERDFFALVTFDTNVDIVYAGGKMTRDNKDIVMSKVDALRAGSSTNLSGGLFVGLDLLKESGNSEVSAVCLLTDGMMNHGIVDRAEIAKLTQEKIASFSKDKAKPSVFTFGYGTDADSTTMKVISEATGGSFYMIENPESVPISFADCLGGLTAVAAQNVELTFEIAGGGAELSGDPLTKFPFTKLSSSACKIQIKDMYCGEHRDLVFKIRVPKLNTAEPTKIALTCRFTDTIHEVFHELKEVTQVTRYVGDALPTTPSDAEVVRQLLRVEAAREMEEARAAGERGDYAAGKTRLDEYLAQTTRVMADIGLSESDDVMMAEVVSDLKTASDNMRSSVAFKVGGKAHMESAAQSHAFQRSNKVDSMMCKETGIERSAYANVSKKTMMQSAKSAFM